MPLEMSNSYLVGKSPVGSCIVKPFNKSYCSDDSYTLVTRSQGALDLFAVDAGVQVVAGTEEIDGKLRMYCYQTCHYLP